MIRLNKKIFVISFSVIILFAIFINISFNRASSINKFILTKIYKDPANVSFTDQNFYNCVVDAYNSENDTSIPYTTSLTDDQLKTITSLICSAYEFSDSDKINELNGIEKLTNLDSLIISFQNIETIDLSSNLKLTQIRITNNDNLSNVNITMNTLLTTAMLYNNNITTIDVTKNTLLQYLDLGENNISSINLDNNVNLKKLYLFSNNIQSINLYNNTKLDTLSLSKNNINSIDLSKNILLTDLELTENNLSTIDLSKNVELLTLHLGGYYYSHFHNNNVNFSNYDLCSITDGEGNELTSLDISKNTKLKNLNINGNNISTLNLSNNNLYSLYAEDNNLSELDLTLQTNLNTLRVSNNQLTTLDLSNNSNLYYLYLDSNNISNIDLSNTKIKSIIYLRYNSLKNITLSDQYDTSNIVGSSPFIYQSDYTTYINFGNNKIINPDSNYRLYLSSILLIKESVSVNDLISNLHLQNLTAEVYRNTSILSSSDLIQNDDILKVYDGTNKVQNVKIEIFNNSKINNYQLYKSIIDSYNEEYDANYSYSDILTDEELNSITSISISDYISNLTGIEYLNNLEVLKMEDSGLKSIDLSGLSKLKSITISNSNDNTFSSLNLPNNNLLECLVLKYGTINSIDLNNQNNLKKLYLYNIPIETIDLSKNTKLTYLNIENSNINKINLSKNLELVDLYLRDNNISNLDISNNLKLETVDLSRNKLVNIDLSKNSKLRYLYLNDNKLTSLDLSNNTLLIGLNVKNNLFEKDVYVYKNDTISSDLGIKLPTNKTNTLVSIYKNNLQKESFDTTSLGEFEYLLNYNHNIQSSSNTYDMTINLYVVEATSSKYIINSEKNYIYTKNDVDASTILSNITLNYGIGYVENNKYIIKGNNEIIREFDLINISSNNYDLSKNYIYTGVSELDLSKINVVNGTKEVSNNKLIIKYDDVTLDSFDLVSVSSNTYDLSKDYIYIGVSELDLSKINVVNGTKEVSNNKLIIKYDDVTLGSFDLVSISSNTYDLSKNYIYAGVSELDLSKINVVNGTKEIANNKLIIKCDDVTLDSFDIVSISSNSYYLSKNYIYIGVSELDLSKINVVNGTKEVSNNKLIIKCDDATLDSFDIVSVSSNTYDLSQNYIYIGIDELDLTKINVINGTKEIENNKLIIKYGTSLLKEYPIYKINFGTLVVKGSNIVITEAMDYNTFISNITSSDVTFKVFNNENEVTSGNVDKEMKLNIYKDNDLIYTYNITDEFLEFDSSISINENNNFIKNISLSSTAQDMIDKITTSGTVTIKNNKNEVITGSSKIGTGTKINIELSTESKEYTVIIKGDVTGTGSANVSDVAKLYQYYKGKITMDDCYREAGNVVGTDNEIKIGDVAKLYQYIKGKINSLED